MNSDMITSKVEYFDSKLRKIIYFNDKELWYEFPIHVQDEITNRLDPFIYALIFPMMKIGGDFYFDGMVSKSVLDNLDMFAKIWNIWKPDLYKPIVIHANEVEDVYKANNKMVSAFSGGVDAAYTAYKYKKKLVSRGDYDLVSSIMIHGADISLKDCEQFDVAFLNAKKMTDDLGITLIPVKTNFRDVFDCNWEHCFASVITSVLVFWGKNFANGVMASDYSVHTLKIDWGQNPITDRFLSSSNFNLIVDGYEHSRTQRANFVKDWSLGVNNLRVCWRNQDKSKNCGVCEKCVRTKLNFYVNGIDTISSMPFQFDFNELSRLTLEKNHLIYYQEIINYAKKYQTVNPDDIKKLEKFIIRNKKAKSLLVKIVSKLLGNTISLFISKLKNRKLLK